MFLEDSGTETHATNEEEPLPERCPKRQGGALIVGGFGVFSRRVTLPICC